MKKGEGAMKREEKDAMKKSPALYLTMLAVWTALTLLLWVNFIPNIGRVPFIEGRRISTAVGIGARVLLIFNGIFISYFWLNGVKDFIYVIWYYAFRRTLYKRYYKVIDTDVSKVNDKILMAYCTCNDFDGESLEKSLDQSYKNFDVVILDDSTTEEYKSKVNEFALARGIKVVRRTDRKGFKAGNINNYFFSEECKAKDYAFYVILDSDEILPKNYLYESLKYFYAYDNVGLVQANHLSDRNRNFFMTLFHVGVNSHWPTYQTMKHFTVFRLCSGTAQ